MKFLIFVIGIFALAAPSYSQSCVSDTTKCESVYNSSVPNDQGSHAIFCQLTDQLVSCIEAQAARVDCSGNVAAVQKLRKKAQEIQNLHNCAAIAAANKCQTDLDKCSRDFNSAIAQVGKDQAAQCQAGTSYIKCLQDRDSDPGCKGKTAAIDDLRKKTQEQISEAGCGSNPDNPKLECNDDVKTCETRFRTDVTESGTDVTKACAAGAALEACLKGREGLPDCKGSQSTIDQIRKTYVEQIDQDGCGSAHAMHCVQGVQDCTTAYNNNVVKLTTADAQCKSGLWKSPFHPHCPETVQDHRHMILDCPVMRLEGVFHSVFEMDGNLNNWLASGVVEVGANAYIDCLNSLSCSAAYHGQLEKGVTMVTNVMKGGNCKLKSLHGSAWTVKPAIPAILILVIAAIVA